MGQTMRIPLSLDGWLDGFEASVLANFLALN